MSNLLVEDLGEVGEKDPGSADGRHSPQTEFQNSQSIRISFKNLAYEEIN